MKPIHRFFCVLLSSMLVLCAGTAAVNIERDPLGILRGDFSGVRQEPDQHFVKMRYILSHPDRYDSFAFGSSRMAKIDLSRAGDGWYCLSYSQGASDEWLADLKQLLAAGVPVRRLLIGLDDASFRLPPGIHEGNFDFRRPYHPYDVPFYLQELFRRPQRPDAAFIAAHGSIFDIYGTGRVFVPERVDAAIDANPAAHAQDERLFSSSAYRGNHMEETLTTLKELKSLAETHGIEITFFFHPIYQTTYMDNDAEELDAFKRQLAAITDYYDFSGLNAVTQAPQCYYESSHYRPSVGDKIVDRIYGNAPESANGFGAYVTASTVDAHLAQLAAQRGPWEAAHPHFHEEQALRRGWTAYLPERFAQAGAAEPALVCHTDQQPGNGHGHLTGWLTAGTERTSEVLACLSSDNGTRLYMRLPTLSRPDIVQSLHNEFATGFDTEIPVTSAPPSGRYQLSILVRTESGHVLTSTPLGNVVVP